MMEELTIKEFHTYQNLARHGIVPAIACPVNADHLKMLPDIDDDGKLFLYCPACNVKKMLGHKSVIKIRKGIYDNIVMH